jgi:hypothetical protein
MLAWGWILAIYFGSSEWRLVLLNVLTLIDTVLCQSLTQEKEHGYDGGLYAVLEIWVRDHLKKGLAVGSWDLYFAKKVLGRFLNYC